MKIFSINVFLVLLIGYPVCLFAQQKERQFAFETYKKYYDAAKLVRDPVKDKSIDEFRQGYNNNGSRNHSMRTKKSWQECLQLLGSDGRFVDLIADENEIIEKGYLSSSSHDQSKVGDMVVEAFNRLWNILLAYKSEKLPLNKAYSDVWKKALLHYGNLEIGRANVSARFHTSCFAMPTAAMNMYYILLPQMDAVEKNEKNASPNDLQVCDMLKMVAFQSWTQPLRYDFTDKNVVQIERFRKHVWWVGGNALGYRSLLPVAFMYKSIPMVELLSEVFQKGISTTSQVTYDTSFWTEGFTADGAGWGHGMQCLVWGYPIDGTAGALNSLKELKGSPWEQKLTKQNTDAILNYLRGSNWYYYKGYSMSLGRHSMNYSPDREIIKSNLLITTIFSDFLDSFTPAEQVELKQLAEEIQNNNILMENYPSGMYYGTRWFFNNDDLIKKNVDYHIMVNMASIRCDGYESAPDMADAYNFCTADGALLFMRNGDEYYSICGAWDALAYPGVTAREGMDKLTPVTNWKGYCSKFNYAGAATLNGDNAVAGYIFEKVNGSEVKKANDVANSIGKNEILYGVKAHKSYFMLGDYTVALGAGITNLKPEMEGNIRTAIDQTSVVGDVSVLKNGELKPIDNGLNSFFDKNGAATWIVQKGQFAYTVLPEYTKEAYYTTETRKADWVKMSPTNIGKVGLPEKLNVLQLWANHGQRPVEDTYGYVVYAGKDLPSAKMPFTVLKNDTTIQSLQSADNKVVQVVFYGANQELKANGYTISNTVPCVVMIDNGKISVCDPTMNKNLKSMSLKINGKAVSIQLPQGELCGKPSTISLKI